MIPISDENPTRITPIVTWSLIAACILGFLWELTFDEESEQAVIQAYGFVPRYLFDHVIEYKVLGIPWPWLTLITSMFLHGGFLHLGGNMLYLWIFGNNVEDAMGRVRYLFFYLVCGIIAALTEGIVQPHSGLPMVGASGAISGVLSAYVLIYPRAKVTVIIPLGFLLYPTKISAFYVVGIWFALQLLNVISVSAGTPGTAWWAHVGGFAAGAAMTPFLSQFPLFGRSRSGPWG